MKWWHLTIAAPDRETRFVDPARQLAAVKAVARVVGAAALLFCVVDDHVHLVCAGTREQMGRIASALSQALTQAGCGKLEPARINDVKGRAHLESLVPYVLSQTTHHHLGVHPAVWAGSCLADLVGARILEGFDPQRLAHALPRREIEAMALFAAGLGAAPLDPLPPATIRHMGPVALWAATGAAVGSLAPHRHVRVELDARAAFARIALVSEIPATQAREAAELTTWSWARLVRREPDPRVLLAVRRSRDGMSSRSRRAAPPAWADTRPVTGVRGRPSGGVTPRRAPTLRPCAPSSSSWAPSCW